MLLASFFATFNVQNVQTNISPQTLKDAFRLNAHIPRVSTDIGAVNTVTIIEIVKSRFLSK
jgi:hypothetical protein